MIDITEVDMMKFAQKVYDLSRPQGMGFLHFQPGVLTDEEAKALVNDDGTVHLDYVRGRACKMFVRNEGGKLSIGDTWYDHTDLQLTELLTFFGLAKSSVKAHGCACACDDCETAKV